MTSLSSSHRTSSFHSNAQKHSRDITDVRPKPTVAAMPWVHLVAGGAGGMTAAVLTSPLDVLKTRLQSDIYRPNITYTIRSHASSSLLYSSTRHFSDTLQILVAIPRAEGWRALFKGLGPNLAGVVPASAIKFYAYNDCKRFLSDTTNGRHESAWVHLTAAATAGIAVSTVTNPIWVVKTRLQLDRSFLQNSGANARRKYKNSLDCARKILQQEGVRGLYRGLSASYLGVAESTLHWVVYEQIKIHIASKEAKRARTGWDSIMAWTEKITAAGGSKLLAASIAYPHEVVRTRLRQAPIENRQSKYTGLLQCCRLVWKEEGILAFYGGFTPHILRVVPSTAIIFGMYELVVGVLETRA